MSSFTHNGPLTVLVSGVSVSGVWASGVWASSEARRAAGLHHRRVLRAMVDALPVRDASRMNTGA